MTDTRSFPDGFLWGTATAAHQIEGSNFNNDWWAWEQAPGTPVLEPSGDACDSWNRFDQDVALVAELGLGVYRFSLEWSRIEPAQGQFSSAALAHYRALCTALIAAGIKPVVTFHHFTTPQWAVAQGGWENPDIVEWFAAYCSVAATALADVMHAACTINEPNVVATAGWLIAAFPPGKADEGLRRGVNDTMVAAHRRAVEVIRRDAPGVPVGLTLSMDDYQALPGGDDQLTALRADMEDVFLAAVDGDDFLGVQAYSRTRVNEHGIVHQPEDGVEMLPMGYENWPWALGGTLRRAAEFTGGRVPLWVTENGIGTDDDDKRITYVREALSSVLDVINDGIPVLGYTYWSLLDNFEWAFGYGPKFGLATVDRQTFARKVKPSAAWLSQVARANALTPLP